MKSASLDTNGLLRLIVGDVPDQTRAVRRLVTTFDSLGVADIAVMEVVYVLEKYYKLGRADNARALELLIGNPALNINRTLLTRALPLYLAHTKLSFADCCLAVYAELHAAQPLWTFDVDLAKALPGQAELIQLR